jgi:hypothetical protein
MKRDSGNILENDNTIRPEPKRNADAGITLPSVRTVFLEARNRAPNIAPRPAAPIRNP